MVSPGKLQLKEFGVGNSATYQVSLSTEPLGEVTVVVTSSDPSIATVSPATLTFDEFDLGEPQTVTDPAGCTIRVTTDAEAYQRDDGRLRWWSGPRAWSGQ